MKVQHQFNTRRDAANYLKARGWVFVKLSLGDMLFRHSTEEMGSRFIVKLNNGKWRIAIL